MPSIKKVMEYSRLNYNEVLTLPTDVFNLMLKNHFVDECMKTDEGRAYLKKAERLAITEPDLEAVEGFQTKGQ